MANTEAREGEQTILYDYLCREVSDQGLSRADFERIKGYPIGHGSVEGFVQSNITLGNMAWRGEKLVNANRIFTLKLTAQEERELERRAESLGTTPQIFLAQIVMERLSEE